MPYRIVKGEYEVKGAQPDGDSVHFRPTNPEFLKGFPQGDAKISKTKGTCQLRMEGLDALELHFLTPADHQEIVAARRARDTLLFNILGFQDVQFNANETATSSVPQTISGYILTNGLDNGLNRRPVAFLFTGATKRVDGSDVFVTQSMLTDSVNAKLLAAGEAYPLYYDNLPAILRSFLTGIAAPARADGLGLWPADKSLKGIKATSNEDLKKHVYFPKLYRRLKDYFVKTGATSLSGFDAWVRADPKKDDVVFILSIQELRHLHSTYKVSGQRIKMLFPPEDLVFKSVG